jgi:hypothetical protein
MSRSGLFNFKNEPIWLIYFWEWADLAYLVLRMSRSGIFIFENEPIWLIYFWEWADMAYSILRMSRYGLFTIPTVFFSFNLFGRTVSVIRDTLTEIFELYRLFKILAFVSLSWFIVRRARRRTADFIQMPQRLSITAWASCSHTLLYATNNRLTRAIFHIWIVEMQSAEENQGSQWSIRRGG